MSDESDEIKRWTARRKSTAVMDIIKGKTTVSELARTHDLTVGEVEQWMDDFVSMGTEALRSHPRDAERQKGKAKGVCPEWHGIKPVWCNESGARFQHIRREVC